MDRDKSVLCNEPVPILTVHSHHLAFLDVLGGDFHFALCVQQPITGQRNGVEYILNNRISMPVCGVVEALPRVIARLPEIAAQRAVEHMIGRWRSGGLLS